MSAPLPSFVPRHRSRFACVYHQATTTITTYSKSQITTHRGFRAFILWREVVASNLIWPMPCMPRLTALSLCLFSSYHNNNHVKQKSNHDPSRVPRVYTVAGSCCEQPYLAHAVHATSHSTGSWCSTLLWVSDGKGQITLLRLVSSLGPLITRVWKKRPYSVLDSITTVWK